MYIMYSIGWLYGQISKWFQNHSYIDRKESGKTKKKMPILTSSVEDDGVAIQEQICELKKECAKKNTDCDKIVRLLSLTLTARRENMFEATAATRVTDTIASLKFHHM